MYCPQFFQTWSLVTWRHRVITWNNVDLSPVRSSGIHLRAIYQEVTWPVFINISLKVAPGASGFMFCHVTLVYQKDSLLKLTPFFLTFHSNGSKHLEMSSRKYSVFDKPAMYYYWELIITFGIKWYCMTNCFLKLPWLVVELSSDLINSLFPILHKYPRFANYFTFG